MLKSISKCILKCILFINYGNHSTLAVGRRNECWADFSCGLESRNQDSLYGVVVHIKCSFEHLNTYSHIFTQRNKRKNESNKTLEEKKKWLSMLAGCYRFTISVPAFSILSC